MLSLRQRQLKVGPTSGRGLEWLRHSLEARKAAVSRLSIAGAVSLGQRWRQELGVAQVRAFHAAIVQATRNSVLESAHQEDITEPVDSD